MSTLESMSTENQDLSKELWIASKTGNYDHVIRVCNSGADINTPFGVDLGTPLQRASKKGFTKIVRELLMRGANVDLKNRYGNTATHFASRQGHIGILKLLAEKGSDLNAQDNNGSTALHFAADEGRHESIITLAKYNAEINVQNRWGDTAGHWGAHQGHVKVVQELLKHGLNAKIWNKEGLTALMKAKPKVGYWAKKGETEKYEQYMKVVDLLQAAEEGKKLPDIVQDLPAEILSLGEHSVKIFQESLETGTENSYIMKYMVVGHTGAGKTTLTRNILFREQVVNSKILSTSGIGIYPWRCRYDRVTKEWIILPQGITSHDIYDKLADIVLQEMKSKKSISSEEEPSEPCSSLTAVKSQAEFTPDAVHETDETKPKILKLDDSGEKEPETSFKIPIIGKTLEKLKSGNLRDRYVPVTVWDFGGHSIFYTTHQTFMSPRCIYLLVFDASKKLIDHVQHDTNLTTDRQRTSSVIEYISFWVNSITTYAIEREKGHPKIILIGTHKDVIPKNEIEQKTKEIFLEIEDHFRNHPAKDHLIIDQNLLLNAKDAYTIESKYLRQLLSKIAENQPFWGEKLPAKWIPLEEAITDRKLHMTDTIISFKELQNMNETNQMINMSIEELRVFLQFHHSVGNILYFPEHSLHDFVILDPKLLVEALQTFITDESLFDSHDVPDMSREIQKTGIIHETQIDKLWQDDQFHHFLTHKRHLIQVMERLDLIARPRKYTKEQEADDDCDAPYYLVPCLLRSMPEQSDLDEFYGALSQQNHVTLSFTFSNKFLPPALYHRLVACCISVWMYKAIYSGFCSFTLDPFHTLTLIKKDFRIHVHISHKFDRQSISKKLCSGTQKFLNHCLTQLINSYRPSEIKVKYNKHPDRPFVIEVPCCFHGQASFVGLEQHRTKKCEHISGIEEVPSDVFLGKTSIQCDVETDASAEDIPLELIFDFISRLLSSVEITSAALACHLELDVRLIDTVRHNHISPCEEFFNVLWTWYCDNGPCSPVAALKQQLLTSLGNIESHNLFSRIDEFSKTNYRTDISDHQRDLKFDDCRFLANLIGKRYPSLGRFLGLSQYRLEHIEIEHSGDVKEKIYQILTTLIRSETSCTRQDICSALNYIGRNDIIVYHLKPRWSKQMCT